jgi:DNA-binding LacI/PurR family transcriptional regulator
MREVAEAAGVSISTVSRAFSSPDRVSPTTLQAVMTAAAAADFSPNRAASGLITGLTGNVGVVLPDITNPFFPPIVKGITDYLAAAQYSVFLALSEQSPAREQQLIQHLLQQVDGLVVCSSVCEEDTLTRAGEKKPLVLLNRTSPTLPSVVIDSGVGMRRAVAHLRALGHTAFTYVSGPTESWSNARREEALRHEAEHQALEMTTIGPYTADYDSGLQAADEIIFTGVTAVVVFDDQMALGVLSRLQRRGVRVPEQVSVIGCDDVLPVGMAQPALTTVAAESVAAGWAAADLLMQRVRSTTPLPPEAIALPSQLTVRDSTGPVGAR